MSVVKERREDIIRDLDVLNIGPYLVSNGVLSQQKYTEEFSSLIEDGRAVNGELTPKLFEVILNKPSEFCKALDESVKETHHEGHQELLILLQQNVVRYFMDHYNRASSRVVRPQFPFVIEWKVPPLLMYKRKL